MCIKTQIEKMISYWVLMLVVCAFAKSNLVSLEAATTPNYGKNVQLALEICQEKKQISFAGEFYSPH